MNWRGWLGFAAIGCAGALAYRGDWLAAGGAAVCVLVLAAWWVRDELLATRTRMRDAAELSAALGSVVTASRLAAKKAA